MNRREAGRKGGLATKRRHGRAHYAAIGKKGAATFYQRYHWSPIGTSLFALVRNSDNAVIAFSDGAPVTRRALEEISAVKPPVLVESLRPSDWLLDARRPADPNAPVQVTVTLPAFLLADCRSDLNALNSALIRGGMPPHTWDSYVTDALKDRVYAWQRELLRAEAEAERD